MRQRKKYFLLILQKKAIEKLKFRSGSLNQGAATAAALSEQKKNDSGEPETLGKLQCIVSPTSRDPST